MSARDALLAAVLANPDDDTARLVFADTLEESGVPVAVARARFIRLQTEQAATGFGAALPHERAFDVQREVEGLARGWARAWLAQLPAPVAHAVWTQKLGAKAFRRGFVDGVTLPVALFRDHAAGLFAAAPVTELHLHGGLGASQTTELFTCPHFRRLRSVRLSGGAIGVRVARRLAKCPDLGAVRELDLSGCGLTNAAALDLAKFVARGTLNLLRVRDNRLTVLGINALAGAIPPTAETQIMVGGNPGVGWMTARQWERVRLHARLVF